MDKHVACGKIDADVCAFLRFDVRLQISSHDLSFFREAVSRRMVRSIGRVFPEGTT